MKLIVSEQDSNALSAYSPCPQGTCMVEYDVFQHMTPDLDLSVIVPCYNVEQYLPQCLDSLIHQQTSYSFEIIAVNDGATDGTADILDRYKGQYSNLHVITQENRGLAAARNSGIRVSRGKYLAFVDSDDYVTDGFVENTLDVALHIDADVVATGQISFNESRQYKKLFPSDEHDASILTGTAWGKIFKRDFFSHIVFPEGFWFEDTPIRHLIYPRIRQYVSVGNCAYMYRHNLQGINLSSQGKPKALDTVYITDLVLRDLERIVSQEYLNSDAFFTAIVNQFYLNQCRIANLPDDCRKLVFKIQSEFYNTVFQRKTYYGLVNSSLYVRALCSRSFALAEMSVNMSLLNRAVKILGKYTSQIKK